MLITLPALLSSSNVFDTKQTVEQIEGRRTKTSTIAVSLDFVHQEHHEGGSEWLSRCLMKKKIHVTHSIH
ncbi:hypothetical protein E2C01_076181 [Portunus trituberculatus]|uniref:Uncharacterized protein n=1 Tax=Portunus trituberculatus TaxID=210409 RepID=A0A5B7IJ64_PORTR|nr:hypothetical protein [Portunus trituberculatus]